MSQQHLRQLYDATDPKYERNFDRPNPYIAGPGHERRVLLTPMNGAYDYKEHQREPVTRGAMRHRDVNPIVHPPYDRVSNQTSQYKPITPLYNGRPAGPNPGQHGGSGSQLGHNQKKHLRFDHESSLNSNYGDGSPGHVSSVKSLLIQNNLQRRIPNRISALNPYGNFYQFNNDPVKLEKSRDHSNDTNDRRLAASPHQSIGKAKARGLTL